MREKSALTILKVIIIQLESILHGIVQLSVSYLIIGLVSLFRDTTKARKEAVGRLESFGDFFIYLPFLEVFVLGKVLICFAVFVPTRKPFFSMISHYA